MAPRKAYLELDAQPATTTPYTPMEVMAMMYSRPASMLASTSLSVNGNTAQAARAGAMTRMGPRKNRPLLAPLGTMISLNISFTASAMGCSRPMGPTRLGPMRTCM
jgi:hypothetical protein